MYICDTYIYIILFIETNIYLSEIELYILFYKKMYIENIYISYILHTTQLKIYNIKLANM